MTRLEDTPDAQGPLRRVLGNFGLLLRGRGIAAVMLLGATALTARALGPAEFGMLVLMQTYVLLIRGLLNFKQFQAIIRYGVPAHDAGEIRTLVRLIAVSRRLDRRSILVATALQARLIGMDSADLVETILAEVDSNGEVSNVIVDLENIEFMDSTSLGMLVFLNNRLQIIEGRLVVVNAAATLEQMFKITQLDRMLPVCRDVMKAVAILNRAHAA